MLKKLCIISVILIITALSPFAVYADGGGSYLGELCVSINEYNSFAPPSFYAQLGVISYGNGHFALNGRSYDGRVLFHGTLGIDDDGEIVITLSSTDTTIKATDDFPPYGSSTSSYSTHIVVNPSGMTGHYRIIGFSWESQSRAPMEPTEYHNHGGVVHLYVCD